MFSLDSSVFLSGHVILPLLAALYLGIQLIAAHAALRYKTIWPMILPWILMPEILKVMFSLPKDKNGGEDILLFFIAIGTLVLIFISPFISTALASRDLKRAKKDIASPKSGIIFIKLLFIASVMFALFWILIFLGIGQIIKTLEPGPDHFIVSRVQRMSETAQTYHSWKGSYLGLEDCLQSPSLASCGEEQVSKLVTRFYHQNSDDERYLDTSTFAINSSSSSFCISHELQVTPASYACIDTYHTTPVIGPTSNCGTSSTSCPQPNP